MTRPPDDRSPTPVRAAGGGLLAALRCVVLVVLVVLAVVAACRAADPGALAPADAPPADAPPSDTPPGDAASAAGGSLDPAALEARHRAIRAEIRALVGDLGRAGRYDCCVEAPCSTCAARMGGCRCGEGLRRGEPVCEECAILWRSGRGSEPGVDAASVRSFLEAERTEVERARSGAAVGEGPSPGGGGARPPATPPPATSTPARSTPVTPEAAGCSCPGHATP